VPHPRGEWDKTPDDKGLAAGGQVEAAGQRRAPPNSPGGVGMQGRVRHLTALEGSGPALHSIAGCIPPAYATVLITLQTPFSSYTTCQTRSATLRVRL
jgi:hypothetical protein